MESGKYTMKVGMEFEFGDAVEAMSQRYSNLECAEVT